MKKMVMLCLAVILAVTFTACGRSGQSPDAGQEDAENTKKETEIPDAVSLLDTVWNSYTEEEKFPVMGGDFSEANSKEDAPGVYDLSDADAVEVNLGFPASYLDEVDGAASLMHMMNANTFTCGAFHVKDASKMDTLTAAVRDTILQKQWMCGFPDKLVIATVDSYMVSVYGAEDLVDTFSEHLKAAYASTVIVSDQPIE